MKQKVLLLLVLTLGMYSINGSAQTNQKASMQTTPKESREYKVGIDGFEWYKVARTVNGQKKYGAEDRYGNMIVPTEYDFMYYRSDGNPLLTGFMPEKGECKAWYSKSGKCVIPYTRGYTWISKLDEDEFGTYYHFEKPDGGGICDRNGREVVSVKADGLSFIDISSTTINGKEHYYLYFDVEKNGEEYRGIADANGRIIVPAEQKDISTARDLAKSRLTTTNNPLAGNRHETLAEAEGQTQGAQDNPVARQQQQQGGGTTTVVVEHHRDPVPVQEWQQCPACYGSGQCPYVQCGGSGWYYIGDRRTTCSRCHGSGKCTTCSGRGGQNVTVYR